MNFCCPPIKTYGFAAMPMNYKEADECSHPLLPRRCQASPLSGGLATFPCRTGPNRVRLRCGLRARPCKASPEGLLPFALARLLVERVIYKVNSFQFTRSTRLVLALQRKAKCAYLCAGERNSPPSPLRGRGWTATGALSSRGGTGEGVKNHHATNG